MSYLSWNLEKNRRLKRERGMSFEEIARLIEAGNILGVEENPGHPDGTIYILEMEGYAVVVPFVGIDDQIFLETAFPSRKYTKKYGLKGK